MQETLTRFEAVIRSAYGRLAQVSEGDSDAQPEGMRWSRKQILGHLIDSASNNHQRFVRSQLAEQIQFPGYEQDAWVAAQAYAERPWGELVLLWRAFNLHVLHVARHVPAQKLGNRCLVGDDEPITLGDHIKDYVDHLEHHLGQILDT